MSINPIDKILMAITSEEQAKKAGYFIAGHFSNVVNKLTGIRKRVDSNCTKNNVNPSDLEKKTEFLKKAVGNLHVLDPEIRGPLSTMTAYELMYYRYVVLGDKDYKSREI